MCLNKELLDLCCAQKCCIRVQIQNILRTAQGDGSLVVDSCRVRVASDVAEHFVSDIYRVNASGYTVAQNKKQAFEKALIVKCRLISDSLVVKFNFEDVYKNEWLAYTKVIPALQEFTADGNLPVVKCLYADIQLVVLEDLTVAGYRIVDTFTIEQIHSILQALAKLHSASIVLNNKDHARLEALSLHIKDVVYGEWKPDSCTRKYQQLNFDVAVRVFEENQPIVDMLKKLKDIDVGELVRSKGTYKVINHGDSWRNNILLLNESVKLIDLQNMRFASPAIDLNYFLYVNLNPSTRRENLNQFLEVYLETLNYNIERTGTKFILKLDWLKQEMREFAIVGLISALWILPVFFFDQKYLVQNQGLALSDDEYFDWYWTKSPLAFKERFQELVLDFFQNV